MPIGGANMEHIKFEFDGQKYIVAFDAYTWNRIELPDGRLLAAKKWDRSSYPPKPQGLREINRRREGSTEHFVRAALAQIATT